MLWPRTKRVPAAAGSEPRPAGSWAPALGLCRNRCPEGRTAAPGSETGVSVVKPWASCVLSTSQRDCGWKERKQPPLSSGGLGKSREEESSPSSMGTHYSVALRFLPRHNSHRPGFRSPEGSRQLPARCARSSAEAPSSARDTGLSWSRACGKKCQSRLGRLHHEGSDPPWATLCC